MKNKNPRCSKRITGGSVLNKAKIPHFAYNVPRVERRASAKQGIFTQKFL
nr:MAG TPA: hypothetical protein [Caudoviricetes sp.]